MSRVIDVHIHLTPEVIAQDRPRFLKDEGAWASLYYDPKARMVSTTEVLTMMDAEGVDKALVFGFPWSQKDTAKLHNDWLLEEASRYPDRLVPLASFDVMAPWAPAYAEGCLKAGMAGLGELALYDRGFGPAELQIFEYLGTLCRRYNKVMSVHVNEPIGHKYPGKAPLETSQIFGLVEMCLGVKLILPHFGGGLPFLASLKREVKEALVDVRFDLAAMPFLYDPVALPMALKILGPEYFLLGSDFPLLKPSRYRRYLIEAGLNCAEMEKIMGESAAEFLKDIL